ncbi:MAG TPA: SCO family protein [Stellaceae bacterium]|nr:SCO family protein [Stellaceae bacterium]
MPLAARRGLIVFVAAFVLIAAGFAVDHWWLSRADNTSSNLGVTVGGPFTLVDQNGAVRHDTDFRGQLMLIYFGYTFCPDACPTALQNMSAALDDLGDSAKSVQPIFVTVDPERDTVAQMKLYAANFHPRLVALTGTADQTAAAARAYRIYYDKALHGAELDYLVDHSSFIYLMGRDGHYLAHFGPDASAETLAAAIKKYL